MLKMIGRRFAIAVPLLLVVSFGVFALTAVSSADPARAILGEGANPASVTALRHQLGLDQSTLQRYGRWLSRLFHGDLGQSWYSNVPVTTKIAQGLPITAALVLASIVVTVAVAVPLGLYAGMRPGGRVDRIAGAAAGLLLAMPEFWVALLLVLILSQKLHLLPGTGTTVITADLWRDVQYLAIPVMAISLPQICALYRQTRASAAIVVRQDYVRTARAGGIAEGELLRTRVAKNALVPSVTLLGLQLGRMIGIAAVVESVYGMQGIGSMAVQAALSSDLPIVLGVVLVTAAVVMAANLLADVTCYYLAPKARKT
ncbi:MAG: peptide transporter [Amycolatopsis sp.]|uniref:ABC transporter permease n=1 Tax=Amycolatopsis sp. TaxID=37632 RepID=UPI00261C4639|nr:ABC transporter permease [Amycolatopsis sp.]MCU1679941.1 peptide transporter [Amycolatopsis sp.]